LSKLRLSVRRGCRAWPESRRTGVARTSCGGRPRAIPTTPLCDSRAPLS